MKELQIEKDDAGMRLDRYLAKALPLLPASLAQKYIRTKRIKRNGARVQRDDRLEEGDVLQLYISDEFLTIPSQKTPISPSRLPNCILFMRTTTFFWWTSNPVWRYTRMMGQNTAKLSLITSRHTSMPRGNGSPGSPPLSQPCATGSTGIRAASSLLPKCRSAADS